jgi:pimeloyl-ACP methyl ester carboxylesterase
VSPAAGGRWRPLRPAALAAAAALLAGCTAAGAGAPEPPRTAASYAQQELRWGPCADFARSDEDRRAFAARSLECALLDVPVDHDDPAGPVARIGVLRWRADPAVRVGSLVVNPGGPGASGMSAAADLAYRLPFDEVTRRFDVVGFDPRGVGASDPALRCSTPAERDAERADLDLDTSPAGVAATEEEERAFAQRCLDRGGEALLGHLGTRDVARDLDVLRAALGEERLTYLGYSYGTRIGTAYLTLFPERVRAMVLDGAVDPDRSVGEVLVAQAEGFQGAFTAFARWCAESGECPLGADPVRGFRALVDPLAAAPAPTAEGRPLSQPDAVSATLRALYSPVQWESLRTGLTELAAGRGDTLLALADLYHDRQGDGGYTNAADVRTAVRCVDDARLTDPAAVAEVDARVRAAAPFLDDGQPPSSARGACAFWPVPAAEPLVPDPAAVPPVVVVSTTGDPATPYAAGVELAGALGGRLVTVEGDQHTAYLSGIPCLDGPVTDYLVDPSRLPPDGLRCAAG